MDYSQKLSNFEQTWLASFNEAHYGSNPDHLDEITGIPIDQTHRRKVWRELKRYERDAMCSGRQLEEFCERYASPDRHRFSAEDAVIEAMEAGPRIELVVLDALKAHIISKEWNYEACEA